MIAERLLLESSATRRALRDRSGQAGIGFPWRASGSPLPTRIPRCRTGRFPSAKAGRTARSSCPFSRSRSSPSPPARAMTLLMWRYPRQSRFARMPALASADKVGEVARRHSSVRHLLGRRLDPESATGLALSLALAVLVVGRSRPRTPRLPRSDECAAALDRQQRCEVGRAKRLAALDARPHGDHAARFDRCRDRARRGARARRVVAHPGSLDPSLRRCRPRGRGAPLDGDQEPRRPRQAGVQPGGREPRPLVSERPHDDGRRLLRRRGAAARPPSTAQRARDPRRRGGRDRGRRRLESRSARCPLALGCDRRPRARLGVVLGLRCRLRRALAGVRCRRRSRERGGRVRCSARRLGVPAVPSASIRSRPGRAGPEPRSTDASLPPVNPKSRPPGFARSRFRRNAGSERR